MFGSLAWFLASIFLSFGAQGSFSDQAVLIVVVLVAVVRSIIITEKSENFFL